MGDSAGDSAADYLPLSKGVCVRKSELVRVMMQTLNELGYSKSVAALEDECGLKLHSDEVLRFREGLLRGQWAECLALLPHLRADLTAARREAGAGSRARRLRRWRHTAAVAVAAVALATAVTVAAAGLHRRGVPG